MAHQSTPPNLFLQTPLLYVDGLNESVQDEEIVEVLNECLRLRLRLNRENSAGKFQTLLHQSDPTPAQAG